MSWSETTKKKVNTAGCRLESIPCNQHHLQCGPSEEHTVKRNVCPMGQLNASGRPEMIQSPMNKYHKKAVYAGTCECIFITSRMHIHMKTPC